MTKEEKEKMATEIKEAIRQLESLQAHCESMADKDNPDDEWHADIKALRYGIATLKILDRQGGGAHV